MDLSLRTLWQGAVQRLQRSGGRLPSPQIRMSDVLRPGEDPGIYRAVLTRVDLWAITTHGSITNLGSIIRPRDESVDVQAKPGDYFPGTVLAELQSPQVSAKPGVLPQNGSPYISITRGRDSAVAAVLQVRPDTFSAEKWNFFLSDLKYLIKQGVAVALDASSVGVSFISSQGRAGQRAAPGRRCHARAPGSAWCPDGNNSWRSD